VNQIRHIFSLITPKNKHGIISYLQSSLRPDIIAGLTVAMVVIPQSMAYAQIANLHPIYGIFTAILPAIVGSLFGSSSHLHTGPTNATAMVVFSVLIIYADSPSYPDLVFTLAILSGILLIILGLLRLGNIVRFMSNSVLTGFLAGATLLIIAGQLNSLLGLKIPRTSGIIDTLITAISNLPSINVYVAITAGFSILLMILIQKLMPQLPAALITIIILSSLLQITGWQNNGVILISDLGLPKNPHLEFYIPQVDLRQIPDLMYGVLAVTIIKLVESISISKSIAYKSGQKLNPSKEFFGQGMASLIGGLFHCYPPSGSLSRSAILYRVGGQTRLAGVFSGIFVWIVLSIASGLLGFIPTPSLAAIVVVSAIGLINTRQIALTWKSRTVSRIVMIVTFLATIFSSPENAIFLGAVLSIVIYLVESRHLEVKFINVSPEGQFVEKSYDQIVKDKPPIILVDVEGDFFFGAADELEEKITPVLQSGVRVLIIRVRHLRLMSSTGINAINGIIHTAQRQQVKIIICGVKESISKLLDNSGVSLSLGSGNIFYASEILHDSTQKALIRAKELIKQ